MIESFKEIANSLKSDIIEFTQKLIQTPSLTGNEEHIAEIVFHKMKSLGYDDVFIDDCGNVVGILKGEEKDKDIVFSSHLDHGEPEEKSLWEYDPYSGNFDNEFIYGIGSSDCKASIASQIYSGYILKKLGLLKKGNYIAAFTVQEGSASCFGTKYLYEKTFKEENISPKLVVLGNSSSLNIYIGQRGRAEIEIVIYGRTNHSIIPKLGINAIYKSASVIKNIEDISENMPFHPMLGESSIAITKIVSLPNLESVVPDRAILSIDRRFLHFETLEEIKNQLKSIIDKLSIEDQTFKAEINIKTSKIRSYTGYVEECNKVMMPFLTDTNNERIKNIFFEIKKFRNNTNFGAWYFNTDGGYTSNVLKIPTIGYSAGEEKYYGTPFEKVSIENMISSIVGNCLIYFS